MVKNSTMSPWQTKRIVSRQQNIKFDSDFGIWGQLCRQNYLWAQYFYFFCKHFLHKLICEKNEGADNKREKGLWQFRRFFELGGDKVKLADFFKGKILELDFEEGPCQNTTFGVAVFVPSPNLICCIYQGSSGMMLTLESGGLEVFPRNWDLFGNLLLGIGKWNISGPTSQPPHQQITSPMPWADTPGQ